MKEEMIDVFGTDYSISTLITNCICIGNGCHYEILEEKYDAEVKKLILHHKQQYSLIKGTRHFIKRDNGILGDGIYWEELSLFELMNEVLKTHDARKELDNQYETACWKIKKEHLKREYKKARRKQKSSC